MNTPLRLKHAPTAAFLTLVLICPVIPCRAGDDLKPKAANPPASDRADIVAAAGTVEPESVAEVAAEVAGTIIRLNADFRSEVEEGTVLAQIDNTSYQIDLTEARAKLGQAAARLSSTKTRLDGAKFAPDNASKNNKAATAPESDLASATATFREAQAAVEGAQADVALCEISVTRAERALSQTTIRSPIKGVVIDRLVNRGQTVVFSLKDPTLFLIGSDMKRMDVWLQVPETDMVKIHPGQPVRFRLKAVPDEEFTGVVKQVRLNAAKTETKVVYTVVVAFDNTKGKAFPYMTASAEIDVNGRDGAAK